jgi:hypothetical protein
LKAILLRSEIRTAITNKLLLIISNLTKAVCYSHMLLRGLRTQWSGGPPLVGTQDSIKSRDGLRDLVGPVDLGGP